MQIMSQLFSKHRKVKVKEREKSVSQEVQVTIETHGFIPFFSLSICTLLQIVTFEASELC